MKKVRSFLFPRLAALLKIVSMVFFTGCWTTRQSVDLTPSGSVDLPRYLGRWHEIARFDHWFERGLSHTKATYTLLEDGCIRVVNTGLKDGMTKEAVGKAKQTLQPGLLRVTFFWPFYGEYRILWVDENYQHALVGGENSAYLWILARTPTIEPPVRKSILAEARCRGYDTEKLVWIEQK